MHVVAIVNHKGGCGKTTTAVNLAGSLAAHGSRVLIADVDPQAHATLALGVDSEALDEHLYDVLADPAGVSRLDKVIVNVGQGLDLAPSGIALAALEPKLARNTLERRSEGLAAALRTATPRYDYVLIDCPPSLGLLTFSALRAADEVIVPVEPSRFAIHGVQRLLEAIDILCERIDHRLTVRILATLYDGRTRFARKMLGQIRELFGHACFDTVIRLNVKLREAADRGIAVEFYAPSANGALDHSALAVELEASSPNELRSDYIWSSTDIPDPTTASDLGFPVARSSDASGS